MWKFLWITIFLGLTSMACANTTYYIATNGNDSTGSGTYGSPWATSTKAFSVMVGGDWMIKKYGFYTSTGNGSGACITIGADTFPAHTSNTITLAGETPMGYISHSTSAVITQGCATAFDISFTSYIAIQDQYIQNSGRAIQIWDCPNSKISVKRVGIKNGAEYVDNFGNVIDIGSGNGSPKLNSSDILIEDVWIVGSARYMIINGGAEVYSEHNLLRRIVMRSDGNNGNNPKGGISMYGPTGTILGARNSHVQQSIALNFNNDSFFPGEDVYGGFYCPWGPTGITFRDCIVLNMGNGWRGYALGEGSAANNQVINSVSYKAGKQGVRLTGASNSSMTVVNCLLAYSTDPAEGYGYEAAVDVRHSLIERNAIESQGATNDDFNAYESTVNPAGSTNEVLGVHSIMYITSMTDTDIISNGIGPNIIRQLGQNGTFWGESGWDTYQSNNLWPYPYESQIKVLFKQPDTGDAKANNSTNNTSRGWAGSTYTLTGYIWSVAGADCPDAICNPAPVNCNSTDLSANISSVTTSSFTAIWTDSSANHSVAMASDVNFSTILSSGNLTGGTSGYIGLQSNTQYWFKVKVATDCDYNASVTTVTLSVPVPGPEGRSQFKGAINLKGSIFFK